MKLQTLMNQIAEWSDATFGKLQRNPAIVYHLKKEVDELIKEFEYQNNPFNESDSSKETNRQMLKMEFADCFMLLLDSAHHANFTADELINAALEKLEVNKKRTWGKPDENGVVEHIKD